MKILSAEEIRLWDQYTIQHEPISSIDLMERAAGKCVEWLEENNTPTHYAIFCGKGNNGGDGLAIARILAKKNILFRFLFLSLVTKAQKIFKQILRGCINALK